MRRIPLSFKKATTSFIILVKVQGELFLVIWHQEIGILQVQLCQPINWSYQVFYHVEALHLEVLLHNEPVQCLKVYHWPMAPVLFGY